MGFIPSQVRRDIQRISKNKQKEKELTLINHITARIGKSLEKFPKPAQQTFDFAKELRHLMAPFETKGKDGGPAILQDEFLLRLEFEMSKFLQ